MVEMVDNWDDERSDIIDDTLGTLRDQRDEAQENHLYGTVDFSSQVFSTGNHHVLGPITFQTGFTGSPVISLTQQQQGINQQDVPVSTTATNYSPFLVQPYVYSVQGTQGIVDGFYIGMYALTPVGNQTSKHSIHWTASGKASVYRDERDEEVWTEQYDHNEPDFLVEDAGEDYIDDSGEE